MSKAAQGFAARRTWATSQPRTRGQRRSSKKEPFMDGHKVIVRALIGVVRGFTFLQEELGGNVHE